MDTIVGNSETRNVDASTPEERARLEPPHGVFRCPVDDYRHRPRPRHWLIDEARAVGVVVTCDARGGLRFRGPTRALGCALHLVRVVRPHMLAVLTEEHAIREDARARWEALTPREQNCVMWYATAEPGIRCPRCSSFVEDCDLIDELEEGPDPSCAA